MKLFQKTDNFLGRYKRIVPVCKVLKPIFTALFYVCCVLAALLVVIAFILIFINVDVDKMLLPPDMSSIKDEAGEIVSYSLRLGNGIEIVTAASDVTLGHIKLVIYAKAAIWFLTFLCIAPVFRFMSNVFGNIAKGNVLGEENAKYINITGVIIAAGSFLFTLVNNVFNYAQIHKFVSAADIKYATDIQWFGIVLGVFIIIIGTIYGYACSLANNTMRSPGQDITLSE